MQVQKMQGVAQSGAGRGGGCVLHAFGRGGRTLGRLEDVSHDGLQLVVNLLAGPRKPRAVLAHLQP